MSDAVLPSPLQNLSTELSGLVADAAQSVVAVHSQRSRSSGFVCRPGLIVTADDALAEEENIAVALPGGHTIAATLAGRDSATDVALLRVKGSDLQPIALDATSV